MADTMLIGVGKETRLLIRQSSGFEPNERNLHTFFDLVNLPQ